jgi:hypothetical protein
LAVKILAGVKNYEGGHWEDAQAFAPRLVYLSTHRQIIYFARGRKPCFLYQEKEHTKYAVSFICEGVITLFSAFFPALSSETHGYFGLQ